VLGCAVVEVEDIIIELHAGRGGSRVEFQDAINAIISGDQCPHEQSDDGKMNGVEADQPFLEGDAIEYRKDHTDANTALD